MSSADHDHVIGHDNAVPAASSSNGTEGALLCFRGARESVAAVADDNAAGCSAGLYPGNVVLETVGGGTHVVIADPRELMPGDEFAELADEAAAQLAAVIDALDGT
jgi:hypothetical protein